MAKPTKDQLRSISVFNSFDVCKRFGGPVYIGHSAACGVLPAKWSVIDPRGKTDPDAHWRDHGNKSFSCYSRESKAQAFQDAVAWAKENYGVDCTERDPFGGFQATGTMAKAMLAVRGG